jgi:hypothetical protein
MNIPNLSGRRVQQSGKTAIIVLVLVLLVAVGVGAWYLVTHRGPSGAGSGLIARTVQMAPARTQFMLAFDLENAGIPRDTQAQVLGTLLKSREFQVMNEVLQDKLNMTMQEDFLPWMGTSGAFFMVPGEGKQSLLEGIEDSPDGLPPFRALAVLQIRDEAQARASLEKIQASAGEEVAYRTEEIQGVSVHLPAAPGKGLAWAIHDQQLLVGLLAADLEMGLKPPAAGQALADQAGFKAASGQLRRSDAVLGYVDLEGLLKGAPLAEIPSPETVKMLSALRFMALGSGISGRELISDWHLGVDLEAAGPLGKKVFSTNHNIAFESAGLYPKEVDTYAAFNLRMLWNIFCDIAAVFPEGEKVLARVASQFGEVGIDLEQDILGVFSGEFSYSARNSGRIQAAQYKAMGEGSCQDISETLQNLSQIPLMAALGLKDRAGLDRLFGKIPPVAMMLSSFTATEVEGAKVYSSPKQEEGPDAPSLALAFSDKEILLGLNDADKNIAAALSARKTGENVGSLPGFARVLADLKSDNRAFLVSFQDFGRIQAEAVAEMKSSNTLSPEFLQALDMVSKLYGTTWYAAAFRADGIHGTSTVEVKR